MDRQLTESLHSISDIFSTTLEGIRTSQSHTVNLSPEKHRMTEYINLYSDI